MLHDTIGQLALPGCPAFICNEVLKMKKIEWKPEFSVGVQRLDAQHKKIIAVINRLIDDPDAFQDAETIDEILLQLTNYVSDHFLLEEQLLEEVDYPDLLGHSQKHTAYGNKVADYCKKVLNKSTRPDELLVFLRKWWVDHILFEDMQYKSFFESKGIK